SILENFSSHPAWKLLVPTLFLVVLVIFGLKLVHSILYMSLYVISVFFFFFFQVLVSLLFLNLLHSLDLVPLKHYSKSLGERLLVPAICDSVQAVLVMWAKASSSYTGLFPLTVRLLPLLTVGWTKSLKLASSLSIHITTLVVILSGLSIVITGNVAILHSLSLTWLAKVSEVEHCHAPDAQVSILDIYYTQLVNQSWVLGLLCLLHADSPWRVLSQGTWCSLLFHGYLLAILLLGMVLSFLTGITALKKRSAELSVPNTTVLSFVATHDLVL
uniref:Si:ch211-207n2.7 n=1 Tax=Myripristis murdjan TaxID=586833 RepID=A0A667ZYD4_9TELE